MSDVKLRHLERTASASGDLEARARVLVARLRSGDLTHERLELAAYCGDEAAREIAPLSGIKHPAKRYEDRCEACDDLGAQTVMVNGVAALDPCPCLDPSNWRFVLWLDGIARWGSRVLVRASVAAARTAYPRWIAHEETQTRMLSIRPGETAPEAAARQWREDTIRPLGALDAAEMWLRCPCARHEDEWLAASHAVHLETVPWSHRFAWVPTGPWAHDPDHGHNREAPQHAARIAGEQAVREAICEALTSWALGGHHP